ncbi:MAG: nucleobase:cation symporter-2 family protein [Nocardioides sp.]
MTTTDPTSSPKSTTDTVDAIPPIWVLFPLGLQHVLAMYAGAVAVPLIVGGAMIQAGELEPGDISHLIMADLLVAGIATIIQSVGFWRFGVRLPLMQGVTFAAVSPMITIGTDPDLGITAIYGSVIACGVFMMVIAPFFSQLVRFFPPIVTGTIILIIGVSLMRVAAGWFGGGTSTAQGPNFGDQKFVAMAFATLLIVLVIERFGPPPIKRVSVLLGLIVGTLIAIPFDLTDFSGVDDADFFGVVTPFQFGTPTFHTSAIISMLIVGIVIMVETTGDMIAVGEIVDSEVTPRRLADGLRADGLGTTLGGIFNTFPYTAFAQNVGLVAITGVKSRYVATMAGAILVLLGVLPWMAAIVEGVPLPVLGGAGVVLFGMVAASGVRTLSKVRFNNSNILVVAIPIGIAMLTEAKLTYFNPEVGGNVPLDLYAQFPDWFQTIFHSGISAGAIAAILLNLVFNTGRFAEKADDESAIGGGGHDAQRGPQHDA